MTGVSPLRVLVVGAGMYVCGRGTENYGTILPSLYRAKKEGLVGEVRIAATNPRNRTMLAEKTKALNALFGIRMDIPFYPKGGRKNAGAMKELLNVWEPDCAIISVPDHLHYETAVPLIEKGLHCLVVKPLAPTVREVKGLIHLAEKAGSYGAVEFHKRFDRSNLKLRDTLRQGFIGDPLYFVVEYSQRKSIPLKIFKDWVRHTNILQYLGIHYIDIIYFATGASPRRVMAEGQKSFLRRRGVDTFDAIQCLIEWEMKNGSRFTSAILTNWIDPEKTSAMSDQRIKVIGTEGRYEADQKYRGIRLVTDEKGVEDLNPDFSAFYGTESGDRVSFQGYGAESILQFLKDAAALKIGKLKPMDLEGRRPTFRDALVPTAVIEAANRSLAADSKWVNVERMLK